jgi:hypothetical protein
MKDLSTSCVRRRARAATDEGARAETECALLLRVVRIEVRLHQVKVLLVPSLRGIGVV